MNVGKYYLPVLLQMDSMYVGKYQITQLSQLYWNPIFFYSSPKIISTLDQLGLDQKTLWTPMRIKKLKIT
jgi:hypothetical protein